MTYPMKNKEKEKVVKDFIDNKLLCKAMVLWYIHMSVRGESQSFFTKDEEKITKVLENWTLLAINLILTKVSKPWLKGFVHQIELVVTNLEGLKGKKYTISITNLSDEEKEKEVMYLTSNHITVKEENNDEFIIQEDIEEASPAF